ncbi:hypothetical protein [Dokdonia sp. Asnod1-B02]|uniref:hypothetical protein n=1 Tax=Dokdonia sp. Asnod1-B02 TaxID=3160573 RepID=UPI00386E915D
MTIQNAKDLLKENYIKAGLKLDNETLDTLYFSKEDGRLKVSKKDIENYKNYLNQNKKYNTKASECSVLDKEYREQIINDLSFKNRFFRRKDFVFGDSENDETYLEISPASDDYLNFFRFQEQYLQLCLPRFNWSGSVGENGEDDKYEELYDNLYRPKTIKVHNIKAKNIEESINKSTDLIDRCLFSISSLKEIPMELIENWPIRNKDEKTSRNFFFEEQLTGNTLPIPKLKLNSTLIKFHKQATSTDIPSLKYLAFYQVLEFHFLVVADEQLYYNLSRRINDLKFNTESSNLDKIIKDVTTHKRVNDETEMLKNVLKKYIQEDELINFIKDFETHMGKSIYTSKREVFGISIASTALNTGHVYGNVAKTIKAIRNALVHSSDRHERNDRYIPYSKQGTKLIEDEMPLIKYLADKVIIANASQN